MVSHDLPRSTATNQITFDQRDLNSIPEFENVIDSAGFQLGNLRYHPFTQLSLCND